MLQLEEMQKHNPDPAETDSNSSYNCNETRQFNTIVNAEIHEERGRRATSHDDVQIVPLLLRLLQVKYYS
jgi:hypothetical protein